MKISYNWLKKYIDLSDSPEKLSEILTNIGLEVGGIEQFESVKGGLKGIVVGEVIECDKHPNADKLSVTKVDVGETDYLDIVCGAPNVAKGQKVAVATIGTKLYTEKGEFEIKKAKIRGAASEGMICSEVEIGLGNDASGIMVLDDKFEVGKPLSKSFDVETDIVFEIDLTPNRIDAASHIGVARDIAAYKSINEKNHYHKPDVSQFKTGKGSSCEVDVIIENEEACPRYMGICVTGVKVSESPQWLQNKLKAIGIKPGNNIVDITNFILHETGQPLHAFDKDKIAGNKVIIKTLPEKTKFTTLDNKELELSNEDLMICNEEEGMCIAGVLGGIKSGVTENTQNIFIESAYFNPSYIRKTAKRHAINTDASFRFERGADINMLEYALKRAAILIQEIAGGNICSNLIDVYPGSVPNNKVEFSYSKCFNAIGKDIGKERIDNILSGLEIQTIERKGDKLLLEIPSYRVDVLRQADINEEILRIYGYNNIDIPEKIVMNTSPQNKPERERILKKASSMLVGMGFSEIMCNSLIKDTYIDSFELDKYDFVKLHNPLSKDLSIMRTSLLFGGLESIAYNINRKNSDIKFFEFGKTYFKNPDSKGNEAEDYNENLCLGLWISGNYHEDGWSKKPETADFFHLKSVCENILNMFDISLFDLSQNLTKSKSYKACLSFCNKDTEILKIGDVNKELLENCDIEQEVFFAEFNWEYLLQNLKNKQIKYTPISKFPHVKRDLSILIDKNVSYQSLYEKALKTEPKLIKEIRLFDVYKGKNIPEDKISYALSFTLEDKEKTMTDKQIDKTMKKIIKAYKDKFGAELR